MNTGIIILAAGNSSRLGKPKQLLTYRGKTLIDIISDAALSTPFRPVVTVLGAYAKEIRRQHKKANIDYALNDNWQQGMSSSIATGLWTILNKYPQTENVIITVTDQAFITGDILEELMMRHKSTGKGIISSTYDQTKGTPVLFNKKYFQHLYALNGNKGAKNMLKLYPQDTESIIFEKGYIDIDTEADYTNLNKNQ